MGVEFEIEFLVLSADQLRLCGILNGQHLCANPFNIVAQLTVREPLCRERINDAEDVAELVIETRSQNALRQCPLDVGDFLANLIPDVRNCLLRRIVENVDINRRGAWLGFALEIIEGGRLLKLLLDAVGDLQHRVIDRRARPIGANDHRLDRKRGILLAPELAIREHARYDKQDHPKPDERAMVDCPFGKIEPFHWAALAFMRATF